MQNDFPFAVATFFTRFRGWMREATELAARASAHIFGP
jgi:hypothetical protein